MEGWKEGNSIIKEGRIGRKDRRNTGRKEHRKEGRMEGRTEGRKEGRRMEGRE